MTRGLHPITGVRLRHGSVLLIGALLAGALLLAPPARATDETAIQAQVLARALAYDRDLKRRAAGSMDIGILYSAVMPAADGAAEKVMVAFRDLEKITVQGLRIHVSLVRTGPDLGARLKAAGIDAVFLVAGIEAEMAAVLATTRELKIISMGSKRLHVEKGAAIGVVIVDRRPTIVVNLAAAKAEGAMFGSDLLKVASIVQ